MGLKISHAEFLSLKESPERTTSLPVELSSQNKNRTLSGIFRLLLFLLKSSHPKKILAKFYYPQKIQDRIFFLERGGGAFWSENEARLCLSGMVFEGTTGVYERFYHFCFKCLRKKEKYANSNWIL